MERRKLACIYVGAAAGFVLAFSSLELGEALPPSIAVGILVLLTRLASILVALPLGLLLNWYMSYTAIVLTSCLAWAILGGILGLIWYQHYGVGRDVSADTGRTQAVRSPLSGFLRWSTGALAIFMAAVVVEWVLLFIISFPFGVCPFRPGLNSILCPDLRCVSEETGVRFPPDTGLLCSEEMSFQDTTSVMALLVMDTDDVQQFLSGLPSAREQSRDHTLGVENGNDAPTWWNPDAVQRFIAIRVEDRKGRLNVLVSLDNPRRARVYLEWCGDRW